MRDLELLRQGVRSLSVDGGEVDRLRASAHLARDVRQWHLEDERSGLPVNVSAGLECLDECRVAREMRQEPQLDLRIVRGEEHVSRGGDESAAYIPSEL